MLILNGAEDEDNDDENLAEDDWNVEEGFEPKHYNQVVPFRSSPNNTQDSHNNNNMESQKNPHLRSNFVSSIDNDEREFEVVINNNF